MTSQGTASGRFTRAVSNALSLCILYRREHDAKFERAAVRWVRRVQLEHSRSGAKSRPAPCGDGGAGLELR